MDTHELLLTKQAEENIDETLATLMEAAQEIAASSEQDFERMKSKKWYKRLWELVTFSKDNQKIQARGVGNLAKLNEITMKAILLVSRQSKEIAEKVCESLKEIQNLQNDVEQLFDQQAKIVETILKIRRGFETEERFDELGESQRDIIFAVVRKYADCNSNQYTQRFLTAMRYIAHETYDDIDYSIIEDELNPKSQKVLYNLLHGFSLLLCGELANEEHELFDYIGLSKNIKNTIRDSVQIQIKQYGEDGYISLFMAEENEDFCIDDSDVEWFEQESEEVPEETPPEVEVIYINNMLHISDGETLKYENKEIHLNSIINCSGTLEFENCVIVYNESKNSDEISLAEKSVLRATKCTFIGKIIDIAPFICLSEDCTVEFDECKFVDCWYFLGLDSNFCADFTNCELYNCMNFVKQKERYGCYDGKLCITYSNILFSAIFDRPEIDEEQFVFSVGNSVFLASDINVNNNSHYRNLFLIKAKGTKILDSSFNNIANIVESDRVILENCVFENCKGHEFNTFISAYSLFSDKASSIKSCVFDGCSSILTYTWNMEISQCKFINCYDALIKPGLSGEGLEISFCEFINYKSEIADKYQNTELSNPVAAITFDVDHNSSIKKCVFDGININEGFLIKPNALEKKRGQTVSVTDCDFRNCSTKRRSGKIIKTTYHYFGMFSKVHHETGIEIYNCRGLNNVKQNGTGVCNDEVVLTSVAKTKSNLGAVVGTIAAGAMFGPAGLAAAAAFNVAKKIGQQETFTSTMSSATTPVKDNEKTSEKETTFRMEIEGVFKIADRRTVVTGRIAEGKIEMNDFVEIEGKNRTIQIAGIEKYKKMYDSAQKGDAVGLLLKDVEANSIYKGNNLVKYK